MRIVKKIQAHSVEIVMGLLLLSLVLNGLLAYQVKNLKSTVNEVSATQHSLYGEVSDIKSEQYSAPSYSDIRDIKDTVNNIQSTVDDIQRDLP